MMMMMMMTMMMMPMREQTITVVGVEPGRRPDTDLHALVGVRALELPHCHGAFVVPGPPEHLVQEVAVVVVLPNVALVAREHKVGLRRKVRDLWYCGGPPMVPSRITVSRRGELRGLHRELLAVLPEGPPVEAHQERRGALAAAEGVAAVGIEEEREGSTCYRHLRRRQEEPREPERRR